VKLKIKFYKTYLRLGICNLLRYAVYKVKLSFFLSKLRRLKSNIISGVFFYSTDDLSPTKFTDNSLPSWNNEVTLFSHHKFSIENDIPDWHKNYFYNRRAKGVHKNWWEIDDFDESFKDIKTIWELSRFQWLITFAQHASHGDIEYIKKINAWLNDWCHKNPPFKGHNWKCGQEASFRVINIIISLYILNQEKKASITSTQFIEMHLERINSSIEYALAQDNNHGTSEAAALYIGGSFLRLNNNKKGFKWEKKGKKLLENRVKRLVLNDGSFSQNSINYHRLFIDTLSLVEFWRNANNFEYFSKNFYRNSKNAILWLFSFIDISNGRVPNIGANDGASLLYFQPCDYKDYRPTIQFASCVFLNARAIESNGTFNEPLKWLNIEIPKTCISQKKENLFIDGGYCLIRNENSFISFRLPKYEFRPSQPDAHHLDLWVEGKNFLRDDGTFSYADTSEFFNKTSTHNTVTFDNRNQMPKISRFLFGDWLSPVFISEIKKRKEFSSIASRYVDYRGSIHERKVLLSKSSLIVEDEINNFTNSAVIRWRLSPNDWVIKNNMISSKEFQIKIKSSMEIKRLELVDGYESIFYLDKKAIPVLEIECDNSGKVITEFNW